MGYRPLPMTPYPAEWFLDTHNVDNAHKHVIVLPPGVKFTPYASPNELSPETAAAVWRGELYGYLLVVVLGLIALVEILVHK